MKTCSKCHIEKSLDSFYKRKLAKDGHEAECKECRKKRNAKWFSENQERHNEMMQDWYQRNKEKHLSKSKEWYEQNKDRKLMMTNKRDRQVSLATPKWVDMNDIHFFYMGAKMLSEKSGIKYEVDHIFPIKHKNCSGLNVPYNLQIITAEENRKKANKLPNW